MPAETRANRAARAARGEMVDGHQVLIIQPKPKKPKSKPIPEPISELRPTGPYTAMLRPMPLYPLVTSKKKRRVFRFFPGKKQKQKRRVQTPAAKQAGKLKIVPLIQYSAHSLESAFQGPRSRILLS
ncbi:hypothetical protein N7492_004489 [Penicillium capsulatum]|uniref:Uncharacterized protein n=1 Tax=Penicillium capsulatum TaxID=69766 RepID=A0A9W9LQT0_9EURO|nr:hypothetical protein N7492_004489 [Penicillium capsulatum]